MMNPEYGKIINDNLALLNNAMPEGVVWDWEPTGGGCDAFIHNTANGKYFLITVADDASIPTGDDWGNIALGLYNEDSEILGDIFVGSLDDVVAMFGGKQNV